MGELSVETIQRHRIEDLAEDIWTLADEGICRLQELRSRTEIDALSETLERMQKDGLVIVAGDEIRLTDAGAVMALEIVRRHRLAETLFSQVFDLKEEEAEKTACEFEHLLSAQVTDSVCTYLGHPPACPHGKEIPRGRCCDTFSLEMEPLIRRLGDLRLGEGATIVFMAPDARSRLARLSALGVVPGGHVRLVQKRPSVVLEVGETTLALDREIADEIFVRRLGG